MSGEIKLLMLGDSITSGYNPPENTTLVPRYWEGSARGRISERALLSGVTLTMVGPERHGQFLQNAHAGYPGHYIQWMEFGYSGPIDPSGTTSPYTKHTPGIGGWLPLYQPDVLAVMAGTNNVVLGLEAGALVLDRLESLINAAVLLRPTMHILVSTLPTTKAFNPTSVPIVNAGLRGMIEALGNPLVHYADAGGQLNENDLYDVHPHAAGYLKFGDAWWQYLQPVFDLVEGGSVADAHAHG